MGFTLVDLNSQLDLKLLELATRAGLDITLEDVRSAQGAFWQEWVRQDAVRLWEPSIAADQADSFEINRQACLRLGITDPTLHAEAYAYSQQVFHDPATFRIFPDVLDALVALRAAIPTLGIVSNWGWWLPELCVELGLAEYFDFIITSARVGAAKPNPVIFQKALTLAGSSPEDTLHVGDSLYADVRGAQAVGITGVLLDRTDHAEPNDYPLVHRLDEVLGLL